MTVHVRRHLRRRKTHVQSIDIDSGGLWDPWKAAESILRSPPHPTEVPKVSQSEITRLYTHYASGIEDLDLLEEVESKLLARAELTAALNVARRIRTFNLRQVDTLADQYDIQYGDMIGPGDFEEVPPDRDLLTAIDHIHSARKSMSFPKRIIAIDNMIHATHASAPWAYSFIGKHPKSVTDFLDWLAERRPA